MTTTPFYVPKTITQVNVPNPITSEPSVAWESLSIPTSTVAGLYTISGFWQEKFLSQTSQLWCTGFRFPASGLVVAGIELELDVRRVARIEDMTIQLTLNGQLIGDNYASLVNPVQADMYTADNDSTQLLKPYNDYHIYGGPSDMWGTELTTANIHNQTFGVVISFRSNVIVPHRDIVYLDHVALRIIYA